MEDVATFKPKASLPHPPSTTAIHIPSTNGSTSSDPDPAAGVVHPGETAAEDGTAQDIASFSSNTSLNRSGRAVIRRHVRTRARGICSGLDRLHKGQRQAARVASATRAWQEAVNSRLDSLQVMHTNTCK